MAFKVDEKLDEDKKPGEEETASQGQVLSSPGAGSSSTGQSAAGTAAKDKTSSGSFTNLQAYVGANTGADKAMVNRVGNTVTNAQNTATASGNALGTAADTMITDNTITDTTDVIGTLNATNNLGPAAITPQRSRPAANPTIPTTKPASQNGGRGGNGGYQPPTVVPNTPATNGRNPQEAVVPTTPAPKKVTDLDGAEVKKLWNAEYKGPLTAADSMLDTERGAAESAYKTVNEYGIRAGGDINDRGVLLDDTFATAGQQYGKGERLLDSYLLGAGSEAGTLQNIADTATGYGQELTSIKDYIDGRGGDAKLITDKTKDDTRKAGLGAQTRFETEFDGLVTSADNLNKAGADVVAAAMKKDPAALKKMGLSDSAIAALVAEADLGPEAVKAMITGSADYKLGNMIQGSDDTDYSALMELINGADPAQLAKYGASDFVDGKGNTHGIGSETSKALESLGGLQATEAELKKVNAAKNDAANKTVTTLSKIGSSYNSGVLDINGNYKPGLTDAELTEAASTLGVDPKLLFNARDNGVPLNLEAIMTPQADKKLGDMLSSDDAAEYAKILDFLKIKKDLGASDLVSDKAATLNTSGGEFADAVTPEEAIKDALTEKTKKNYDKAYNAITGAWPQELKDAIPREKFYGFFGANEEAAAEAFSSIESLRNALNPQDFVATTKEFFNAVGNSRNPADIRKATQNLKDREGKRLTTGLSDSASKAADMMTGTLVTKPKHW